jgi:hypothetical protein
VFKAIADFLLLSGLKDLVSQEASRHVLLKPVTVIVF